MTNRTEIPENPFVGLRPFESNESLLFFGRKTQTIQLLQRLHETRFVAIVGGSGSGKSSLIRAGLIPSLKAGFLIESRFKWAIAIMKPGESPIYNLAKSISLLVFGEKSNQNEIGKLYQQIRDEGSKAIIDFLMPIIDNETNFFLLVDQFEEIFRFILEQKTVDKIDEANEFVNIFLELTHQKSLPAYVVLTMRSDFIGDCVNFHGLPEALNSSQYLVPKLNRQELRNVIESPVKLYGGKINQRLTDHLLNNIQDQQDELPILQHLLMRIWEYEYSVDHSGDLDLTDYDGVNGFKGALSQHADEAFLELNSEDQKIAKIIFQALTAVDESNRKIRRPVRISELSELLNMAEEKIQSIIDCFIKDRRCFLVKNKIEDTEDYLVDISHESLIRQWERLSDWVDEESSSSKAYEMLVESMLLNLKKEKDYLTRRELNRVKIRLDFDKHNSIWAKRYDDENYEGSLAYYKTSIRKSAISQAIKWTALATGLLVLILGTSLLVNIQQKRIADENAKMARQSEAIAIENAQQEKLQRERADENAIIAKENAEKAIKQREIAQQAMEEAIIQRKKAERAQREALKQRELAILAKQEAEKNYMEAQQFSLVDEKQKMIAVSRYIGTKSIQITNDSKLKATLAYLSNKLLDNSQSKDIEFYKGQNTEKFQNDVYTALLKSNYDLFLQNMTVNTIPNPKNATIDVYDHLIIVAGDGLDTINPDWSFENRVGRQQAYNPQQQQQQQQQVQDLNPYAKEVKNNNDDNYGNTIYENSSTSFRQIINTDETFTCIDNGGGYFVVGSQEGTIYVMEGFSKFRQYDVGFRIMDISHIYHDRILYSFQTTKNGNVRESYSIGMDEGEETFFTIQGGKEVLKIDDSTFVTSGINGTIEFFNSKGEKKDRIQTNESDIRTMEFFDMGNDHIIISGHENGAISMVDTDYIRVRGKMQGYNEAILDIKGIFQPFELGPEEFNFSEAYYEKSFIAGLQSRRLVIWEFGTTSMQQILDLELPFQSSMEKSVCLLVRQGNNPELYVVSSYGMVYHLPFSQSVLAENLRENIRDLTQQEWLKYVGKDIEYQKVTEM